MENEKFYKAFEPQSKSNSNYESSSYKGKKGQKKETNKKELFTSKLGGDVLLFGM